MSAEAKIKFYKNKKFLGDYFIYNGDCDGKDTFWCSCSEWDGVMKLKMVDNEQLYFNANDEEMFIFEEGGDEYNLINKYINKRNRCTLTLTFAKKYGKEENIWMATRFIVRKKSKKLKKINSFDGLENENKFLKEENKKLEEEIKSLKYNLYLEQRRVS